MLPVPPRNRSLTCPACGHVSAKNRQTQARFAFVECGYGCNVDLVVAINFLAAEHAALACGSTALVGHPIKQEAAEVSQLVFS